MSSGVSERAAPRRRWIVFLPLVVFGLLAAIFLMQLLSGRDSAVVPSALIGDAAPQTELPPLEGTGLPGLSSEALKGEVTLVNVWASWCAPCRQEHPLLMELSRDERIEIAGLNYKDDAGNARGFLAELGNPYSAIGVDGSGRTAIDWGVYGVPETFLVGRDGTILYKHVGPLTEGVIAAEFMPRLEEALAAPAS